MTPLECVITIAALVAIVISEVIGRLTRRARRRARSLIRRLEDRVAVLEADLRHAEADRDHISAELDQAYAAAAELACSRRGAPPDSWPDAEQVLLDAAVQLGKLREQRDALAVELRAVTADRDAIAARAEVLEHAERAQAARSLRRRAAIVRIARHCRNERYLLDATIDATIEMGVEFADMACRRDAVIEAMTRRIAELMPCADRQAFADGRLDDERRAVFRVHLRTCKSCRVLLAGALQREARLTDPSAERILDIADAVQRGEVSLDAESEVRR